MSVTSVLPEALEKASMKMLARMDVVTLHFMENCVSCAFCKYECPFWHVDEKYSPVNKAEEARRIYRKELTLAGRILGPLVHAGKPTKDEEITRILEYSYAACSNCGACYNTCPFGIDSGYLINMLRTFLHSAGATPSPLKELVELEVSGKCIEVEGLKRAWEDVLKRISEALGKDVPLDRKGVEVLLLPSLVEAALHPSAVVSAARVLEKSGVSWTLPSKPLGIRPPLSLLVGDVWSAKRQLESINNYVEKLNVKKVVLLDGGFAYPAFRWDMPSLIGKKPNYEVLHLVEFVRNAIKEDRLKLKKTSEKITWHSPCQLARRGGVTREAVEILSAASENFKRTPHDGEHTYCCGSGDAIGFIAPSLGRKIAELAGITSGPPKELEGKIEKNYKIAAKRKLDDILRTDADTVITACPTCIATIKTTSKVYGISLRTVHIADFIAERLE